MRKRCRSIVGSSYGDGWALIELWLGCFDVDDVWIELKAALGLETPMAW